MPAASYAIAFTNTKDINAIEDKIYKDEDRETMQCQKLT